MDRSMEMDAAHWAAIWALVGARIPEVADKGVWNEAALNEAFGVAAAQYLGFLVRLKERPTEVIEGDHSLGTFHVDRNFRIRFTPPSPD